MYTKTCLICGEEFTCKRKDTKFCSKDHYTFCPKCGKRFKIKNNLKYYKNKEITGCSRACSISLAEQSRSDEYKKEIAEKRKQTNLQRYGVESTLQAEEVKDKIKGTLKVRYGVENPFQSPEVQAKSRQTCKERYGVEYPSQSKEIQEKVKETSRKKFGVENAMQSKEIQEKLKQTNLKKYGVENAMQSPQIQERVKQTVQLKYGVDCPFQSPEVKEKSKQTCREKYGVENPMQSKELKHKSLLTCFERYNVPNVALNPDVKQNQLRNRKPSKLEQRVYHLLDQYHIPYEREYNINNFSDVLPQGYENLSSEEKEKVFNDYKDKLLSHTFDVCVPKYKVLMDIDGLYYHNYLNDPDGRIYNQEDSDAIRVELVPEGWVYLCAVEGHEEKAVTDLWKLIRNKKDGTFDYEGDIFKWCRETGFPYPKYDRSRLIKEWNRLYDMDCITYNKEVRTGLSIIKHFHRSIYDCKVGRDSLTVKQAWEDDDLLKKVIANRLVYKNEVDPSKVLSGFNITKTCGVVSLFNPVLAKYLVETYLSEFDTVFDPFSGFSGRLLGTCATGKKYIGQDLNENVVRESNEIINFLHLSNATVSCKDIFKSNREYECLLTCPPYDDKEIYNHETTFMSCDNWIDECMSRFKCKRYVFVVDETDKYKNNVVMTLSNTGHFAKSSGTINKECVIVI